MRQAVLIIILVLLSIPAIAQDIDSPTPTGASTPTPASTAQPPRQTASTPTAEADAPTGNVIDALSNDANLSIFVTATNITGLANRLSEAGPYTIFAPTNTAFATLLANTGLTASQLIANTELLTGLLQYHIIQDAINEQAALSSDDPVATLKGQTLSFRDVNNRLVINDASNAIATDIMATNGIIHIVDAVLIPPDITLPGQIEFTPETLAADINNSEEIRVSGTIFETLLSNEAFSIFAEIVQESDLESQLRAEGPFTLFVPTNNALATALEELNLNIETVISNNTLTEIIPYHIIQGSLSSTTLLSLNGIQLPTLSGARIEVQAADDEITLNRRARVRFTDIETTNGIIHVINSILIPPDAELAAAATSSPASPQATPAESAAERSPEVPSESEAFIRLAHLSPDTLSVDLYINGALSNLSEIRYTDITGWIEVPAGTLSVVVAPAGTTVRNAAVGPLEIELEANSRATIAIIGSLANSALSASVIEEDFSPLSSTTARLTVFHAIEDISEINVFSDQQDFVRGLAYPFRFEGRDGIFMLQIPAGTYDIKVTPFPDNTPIIAERPQTFIEGGKHYFIAVTGTESDPRIVIRESDPETE